MDTSKIQAAYERDQRERREAVTAKDLPFSFESITDRWLTAVLCDKVPGASVIRHTLGAVDTGTSNRRRIDLEYDPRGVNAGLPRAVFCKASHDLANRIVLGVSDAARCESLFYNTIRPHIEIEAPVAYFARFDDESFNSMIMLNDLTDDVQEFCNHETVITLQRAHSQMKLLGQLHGTCYHSEILKLKARECPSFLQFFNNTLNFGMREGSEAGFAAAQEVIPARLYRHQKDIWTATVAAVEKLDRMPNTLVHGDVHLKNWYVAGNGEMGLGDWQCTSRAHWGRDFAYTIATSLTVTDRRAWERDLLTFYLDQLRRAGGPDIPFNEAWEIYRQQLISALTWWTVTLCPTPDLPDMQPRDITIEFIRRIATAMDDLDSLEAC